MGFGKQLSKLLKAKNVSNNELAEALNVHNTLISQIKGGRNPNWEFLEKLLNYFPDVDANFLLRGEQENILMEDEVEYNKPPEVIVKEIELKLKELNKALSQK